MNNLSNSLKSLRKQANLTQTELSEKLNISRGTYAHYEIGKRNPDYRTLIKLADMYDVSLDELFGRKTPQKTSAERLVREQVEKVVDEFMKENKEKIVDEILNKLK